MALRGNLRDFSLPDVFQLVTLSGKSGVLRIERADAQGSVWFRDGEVFFAQSDWHREPLGTRLVAAGKITPSGLVKALDIQRAEQPSGRRLGEILVDEGFTSDKVLEAFVQEQIQDTIFDLFRWDEGDFGFEMLESAPDEDIGLSVSIENIVMEGSRRLEEWTRIKKKIPSMEIVFKMATAPGEGTFDISLKPVEWNLLLKVDGTRAVAELAREIGRTDFEVARIIYGLFSAGLLEVASDEEAVRLRAERAVLEAAIAKEDATRPTVVREPEPAAAVVSAAPAAPEVDRIVEEPAFLSAESAAPSADDMAVFEQMMGAVLEAPPVAPTFEDAGVAIPAVEEAPAEPEPELVAVTPEPEPEPVAVTPEPEFEPAPAPAFEPLSIEEPELVEDTPVASTDEWVSGLVPQQPGPAPEASLEAVLSEAPTPEVMSGDLADLLATLEAEPVEAPFVEERTQGGIAEPVVVPARTGDFAVDLMALGLGELPPGDLLAPVVEPEPEPEPEPELEPEPEPEPAPEPGLVEDVSEIAAFFSGLGSEVDEEPTVLDTSSALVDERVVPDGTSAPGGVISTDAFLVDFDSSDVSFSSGLGDELTALTGGGTTRNRPVASVAKVDGLEGESPMLHRDSHVDRELVMKIIEGVKRL